MTPHLRPLFHRLFSFDWKLGLFLILLVCISRFALVLNANATGNYGTIGLIMMISAIILPPRHSLTGSLPYSAQVIDGHPYLLIQIYRYLSSIYYLKNLFNLPKRP